MYCTLVPTKVGCLEGWCDYEKKEDTKDNVMFSSAAEPTKKVLYFTFCCREKYTFTANIKLSKKLSPNFLLTRHLLT